MPVNFVQVKESLKTYSEKVKAIKELQAALENELWTNFNEKSDSYQELREIVLNAAQRTNHLWCACPTDEPLLSHHALPHLPQQYTILAADGSQIKPDRHKAVQFCIINVGVIKAHMGSGQTPQCYTHSELLDYDQIFSTDGVLIDEDTVALQRDYAERAALVSYIEDEKGQVITLTDGPLGLYKGTRSDALQQTWEAKIIKVYQQLEKHGAIAAGYIDKPGSDLIGRLFSLVNLSEDQQRNYKSQNRYFKGIADTVLLSKVLTLPAERSAIFQVISKPDKTANESLDVYFFYLNVGQPQQPYLARIEFPAWVANSPKRIDLLHAAVYNEVRVLETHPYPYILHRAHELAVIHFDEYAEVERLLFEEYLQQGISMGRQSNKEANKILSGR
ncbi:MAG: DNA double-strand break repair nuclease NurA [Chloroflexota bacterium]